MRSKMNKRKSLYMALSLLVAVVIWIYVDVSNDRVVTKEFRDIPIEFTYEDTVLADRGLMRLEEGTDTSLSVTLEGTRWNISKLDPSDLKIRVDLSTITTTGIQNLTNYKLVYPRGVSTSDYKQVDASAYMVRVNIGELNSKEVEIRAEYAGNVAEGYTAGELVLSPSSVEIRGQAEAIEPVSYAKVTLNLDNAESTVSQTLSYQFYDKNGRVVESSGIHVSVEQVQVTLPVNMTKELPLTINFIESPGASVENVTWEIQPKSIRVYGDADRLRSIDSISLGDFDLANLRGSSEYNYSIPIPEGCENLSGVTWANLKASFVDMTAAVLPVSQFVCENVPEGKNAEVLTEELEVTIFGTTEDVAAVTSEDILVVADLTDYSAAAGGYTVPARVVVETSGDIGVTGTYQIRVNIRELTEETEPNQTGE